MINSNEISLSKIYPIQEVQDNFIVNGNGDLTFCFKIELPEVYTLNHVVYNDIHLKLINNINRLPAGTSIHKQDIYFSKTKNIDWDKDFSFTRKSDLKHLAFRPVLQHESYIYLTYSLNESLGNSYYNNSLLRLSDYIFRKPFKNIENNLNEAFKIKDIFEAGLRSIKEFKVTFLDNKEDIINLLSKSWNLQFNTDVNENLNPLSIYENNLKIGGRYVGIVSLVGEPEKIANYNKPKLLDSEILADKVDFNSNVDLNTSFSFPIALGLPINHIVNTIIEVTDNTKISQKLKLQSRGLNFFLGFGHDIAKFKKAGIEVYLSSLNEENLQSCFLKQNVVLFNEDVKSLNRDLTNVQIAYSNFGCNSFIENFQTGNLFVSSYPGNTKANFRSLYSYVNNAVCLLPLESHLKSDRNGINFIDRFGNSIVLDLNNAKKVDNRNKLVFGPSGSGKSFLLNHYVSESIQMNYHVILLDKGGSFKDTFKLYNGHYIDTKNYKDLKFNIFLTKKDSLGNYILSSTNDEDDDDNNDKSNFIIALLQKIWKKSALLNDNESAILRKLIYEFYNYINENRAIPSLNLFYRFIDTYQDNILDKKDVGYVDFQSLKNSITPYVNNGEYAFLLNSESTYDINNYRLVAIDLEGVETNPMLYDIISFMIVELATNKIMNLPKSTPKMLLVDEAVDFLIGNTGSFVAEQARKIRKKGGELIIATQSVEFLENVDPLVKQSLLNNAGTKILVGLGKEASALKNAQSFLSLTENDLEIIKTLDTSKPNYRESFIKLGSIPYIVRLEVSPESALVYSTTPKDIDLKNSYSKKYDIESSINQIIENRNEN
jgi:conjugation system TraG family ATPase